MSCWIWSAAGFVGLAAAVQSSRPVAQKPRVVVLKAGEFAHPSRAPLGAEHAVIDRIPVALVPGGHRAEARADRLEIDRTGDGSLDSRIFPDKPRVVDVWDSGRRYPILFYSKMGTWHACSASALHALVDKVPIEFLDADLDGEFAGSSDYVRFATGAFTRNHGERLLADDRGLWSYSLRRDGSRHLLELAPVSRPAQASEPQWAALLAVNRFRSRIGLPPASLSLERSAACQRHADYLLVNSEFLAKQGEAADLGDEREERPGFSLLGREAARHSMISADANPASAAAAATRAMLQRTRFLCDAREGIGVGAPSRPQSRDVTAYSVIWTGREAHVPDGTALVVPGPGQTDVPIACQREEPAAENPLRFYSKARGYPVSVSFGARKLEQVSINLYADAGKTEVKGYCFSPERPIHSSVPDNACTAFFVAEDPLLRAHPYVAVFTAKEEEREVRLVWGFTTE
jgi:hypothetical protein